MIILETILLSSGGLSDAAKNLSVIKVKKFSYSVNWCFPSALVQLHFDLNQHSLFNTNAMHE